MNAIDNLSELAVAIHYNNHVYVEEDVDELENQVFTLVRERTHNSSKRALIRLMQAAITQAESSDDPADKKIVFLSIEAISKHLKGVGKLPVMNFIREARKTYLFSTSGEKNLSDTRAKISNLLEQVKDWNKGDFKDERATRITVLSALMEGRIIRPQRPNESLRNFLTDFQRWVKDNGFELSDDQIIEIMRGAHVVMEDAGAWYKKVEDREDKRTRNSSHYNNSDLDQEGKKIQQYGIAGDLIHELLVGKIVRTDEKGNTVEKTWFQLENTPWASGIQSVVGHSIDFVQYKLSGKNVGPHGLSHHTDAHPMVLKKKE